MAEVKSGVNYEITADDKASTVADKASKNVQKSSKEAGEAFKGEFNPMSAVLAGISGNVQALSQQMLGLVSRLKSVHMTMSKFALYAALVMAVVNAVQALVEWWRRARVEADNISLDKAQVSIGNCVAEQKRLNEEFDKARENTDRIKQNLLDELNATEKLTNARREYNKALDISQAKSQDEVDAIERKYAGESAQISGDYKLNRIKIERDKISSDLESWENQISENLQTIGSLKKTAATASKVSANAQRRVRGAGFWWHFGLDQDVDSAERSAETYQSALTEIEQGQKATEALNDKVLEARKRLQELDKAEETIHLEMATAKIKAEEAEKEAAWAKYREEVKILEEEEQLMQENVQAQEDAEKEKAEIRIKAERAANLRIKAERQETLAWLHDQENQAAAQLAAAQNKVAEAWGWYKDKEAMARQIESEKADAKAQAQYEKDFEKLKWRRDWRTAKDLSVDQEAVRRVALAKEEETAAQKALAETAASTAQAAASLAEIEKVITRED
jgi:hypothetical protein